MEWWWGGKGRLLMAGGGGVLIIERMVYCLKGLIRKLKSPQNPSGARAQVHETWNSSRHWSEERRLRQKKNHFKISRRRVREGDGLVALLRAGQ